MKIELYLDGEKKIFTAPFVPMLAKRKYLEIEARKEEKGDAPSAGYTLDEFDELCMILVDIVFKNQFTLEELMAGASEKYINEKLLEAVFGIKPDSELKKSESEKGNDQEGK